MVPALYRTYRGNSSCNQTAYKRFAYQQVSMLEEVNATAILFLVNEGDFNVQNIPDYLFSQFYSPEIDESNNTLGCSTPTTISSKIKFLWVVVVFTCYSYLFLVAALLRVQSAGQQEAELRVYAHLPGSLILVYLLLWLLAVACIALGSAWMVWEIKYGANRMNDSSSSASRHVCLNEITVNVVVLLNTPAEHTSPSPAQPSTLTGSSTDAVVENGKKRSKKYRMQML
uniref:Uncharacterized protein n=1 Tax=Ditylenchus dipsaci TaxID=166011 RepID=A0A915DRC0_9BILA